MNNLYIGLDIGGTKCAAVIGEQTDGLPRILSKTIFPTPSAQQEAMLQFRTWANSECGGTAVAGVGISAGNPMDRQRGMLLNPPNLPGWSDISWTKWAQQTFGAPALMENDANACALAEWQWGAGKGSSNMIFLTFGTGMGAGLILGGKLYHGACGNSGEIGHCRLSEYGPSGYGKQGSVEGFCSGGGISQMAKTIAIGYLQRGLAPGYDCNGDTSAKAMAEAARGGSQAAVEVFTLCGTMLGKGLALLVDMFNPERIVIGSIYPRCKDLLHEPMMYALGHEALNDSVEACTILPATLGEQIGDYAAISTAIRASE